MSNPWNIEEPFDPMYNEHVVISHGGQRTTIQACVLSDGTGEPLSDSDMDTTREDIKILCRRQDWPFIQGLVRGDSIDRSEWGRKYTIQAVVFDMALGWHITARSK